MSSILLGWSVPEGRRVEVPSEGHLAWFGQTQLSGKTTALEALVARGGFRAIAFITKRGEGSFVTARPIPPYFSEPTNDPEQPLWRWVASILEASQKRTMRFEESWIIRACEDPRQAKSLADVHANINALISGEQYEVHKGRGKKKRVEMKWHRKPVTGINAGVYTSLKAYFDIVMPQLARLPYTKKLELCAGLNVMDLRDYSVEMQALVIRSVIESVYQHERGVRVIVPEAQDFVPQGKNAPVKMACENLVRKGAADKNFMWLDSQDMAAVDKVMVRACSIKGCGVQTEVNEIDRTVRSLFSDEITPADINRLGIGQFYVRLPGGDVHKVYVQPAWMDSEVHAQAIARGEVPVSTARSMLTEFQKQKEAEDAENSAQVRRRNVPGDHELSSEEIQAAGQTVGAEGPGLLDQSEVARDSGEPSADHGGYQGEREKSSPEEAMKELPAARCIDEIREWANAIKRHDASVNKALPSGRVIDLLDSYDALVQAHDALAEEVRKLRAGQESRGRLAQPEDGRRASLGREASAALPPGPPYLPADTKPESWMAAAYQYMKTRLFLEPGVLQLLAEKPELRIKLERRVIEMDGASIGGALARLLHEKFFDMPKAYVAIRGEMLRRGMLPNGSKTPNVQISQAISNLHKLGFLTEESEGYKAVTGMKTHVEETAARAAARA